jgi:hypothetical protein
VILTLTSTLMFSRPFRQAGFKLISDSDGVVVALAVFVLL